MMTDVLTVQKLLQLHFMTLFSLSLIGLVRDIVRLPTVTICYSSEMQSIAILNLHNDHVLNSNTSFPCDISYTQRKVLLIKLPDSLIY